MIDKDNLIVPDFIVIGAMRCGTTTLYEHLSEHPVIGLSRQKETDFFVESLNWKRGPLWYSGLFDPSKPIHGEISPNYAKQSIFPGVPNRIRDHCPNVRLVYILRDPVERMISHYEHAQALGRNPPNPDDLVGSSFYSNLLDTSKYAANLERYLEFFPQDKIRVLSFSSLKANPQSFFDEFLDFIGVQKITFARTGHANSSSELSSLSGPFKRVRRNRRLHNLWSTLSPETREKLRPMFSTRKKTPILRVSESVKERMAEDVLEDVQRLRSLTGQDFGDWSL